MSKLKASPLLERNSIKLAITNLRQAKKSFKTIQIEAKNYREKFLQKKENDEETKVNMKHAKYLRMLIFIETEIEVHSTRKKFKTKTDNAISLTLIYRKTSQWIITRF